MEIYAPLIILLSFVLVGVALPLVWPKLLAFFPKRRHDRFSISMYLLERMLEHQRQQSEGQTVRFLMSPEEAADPAIIDGVPYRDVTDEVRGRAVAAN